MTTTITLPRPALSSPCCGEPLEGGPVVFWCTGCRRDVHGSTINREFGTVPQVTDCTYLHGAFGPGCPHCTPRRNR